MLLSDRILSKSNESLNLETAKWVIANALSIPVQKLFSICQQANHPILQDEHLFDDIPNEVRAIFVKTSLLPRKYFNSAFAWLFGKDSIDEIDANSYAHYEQLESEFNGYSLRKYWEILPFTKEEYDHVYAEFNSIPCKIKNSSLGVCQRFLGQHAHVNPDTFFLIKKGDKSHPLSLNAPTLLADRYFDHHFNTAKFRFGHYRSEEKAGSLLAAMDGAFRFVNLSQDRRDTVISQFGLENFELKEVLEIYNGKVPDAVLQKMVDLKKINSHSAASYREVISDMRIPIDVAKNITYERMDMFGVAYLSRNDVNEDMRLDFISKLQDYMDPKFGCAYMCKMGMIELFRKGSLSLSEVERFESSELKEYNNSIIFEWSIATGIQLPVALQEKWAKFDRMCGPQLQAYGNLPKILDAIRMHYIISPQKYSPLGAEYEEKEMAINHLFKNKGWTGELLLKLIKICKQKPANDDSKVKVVLERLCKGALDKLFSESIYPALMGHGDGVGKYDRAEPAIAYVLRDHSDELSLCDLELFIQSTIKFDYKDANIDLGHVMERYPDLNEAAIAQHLKRRLGQFDDVPVSPRKSHHI